MVLDIREAINCFHLMALDIRETAIRYQIAVLSILNCIFICFCNLHPSKFAPCENNMRENVEFQGALIVEPLKSLPLRPKS